MMDNETTMEGRGSSALIGDSSNNLDASTSSNSTRQQRQRRHCILPESIGTAPVSPPPSTPAATAMQSNNSALLSNSTTSTNVSNADLQAGFDCSSEELRDARLAAKILRERMLCTRLDAKAGEDKDKDHDGGNGKSGGDPKKSELQKDAKDPSGPTSLSPSSQAQVQVQVRRETVAPMPPMAATSTIGSTNSGDGFFQTVQKERTTTFTGTPGAVSVAGIDARSSSVPDIEQQMQPQSPQSSLMPDPSVLIQATLVESSRRAQDLYTSSRLLVEAEPLDESYMEHCQQRQQQEGDGGQDVKLKYVLRNKKLCAGLAVVLCLVITLAATLITGLIIRSSSSSNSSPQEPPPEADDQYPPFSNDLEPFTLDAMRLDPTGPQARANQWVSEDPNSSNYTLARMRRRFSLATFYFATNGPQWKRNDGWLNYNIHECDWYSSHSGPVCGEYDDEVGYRPMHYFNLTDNNLVGTLPKEIRYLDIRYLLDFSHNSLAGSPPAFGSDAKMEIAVLSHNKLFGRLSAELGWQGPHLRILRIDNNQLSGPIPPMLTMLMPGLEELRSGNNLFTGNIPDDYTTASPLIKIDVSNNLLSGTLPRSAILNLQNLTYFNASGNVGLTGTLPGDLPTTPPKLSLLDITNTSLSGSVPQEMCQREQLGELDLRADCGKIQCCSSL